MSLSLDLKPCPFCGNKPEMSKYNLDIGGGDYRTIWQIRCIARDCVVTPRVCVAGESGYGQGDVNTNEAAQALVVDYWNRRSYEETTST